MDLIESLAGDPRIAIRNGSIDGWRRAIPDEIRVPVLNVDAGVIVPITLVRHYVRILEVAYLRGQVYLEPHPEESMLHNHV